LAHYPVAWWKTLGQTAAKHRRGAATARHRDEAMLAHAEHVREIERAAQGLAVNRDATVIQSWRRCLDDYRLDPARLC